MLAWMRLKAIEGTSTVGTYRQLSLLYHRDARSPFVGDEKFMYEKWVVKCTLNEGLLPSKITLPCQKNYFIVFPPQKLGWNGSQSVKLSFKVHFVVDGALRFHNRSILCFRILIKQFIYNTIDKTKIFFYWFFLFDDGNDDDGSDEDDDIDDGDDDERTWGLLQIFIFLVMTWNDKCKKTICYI